MLRLLKQVRPSWLYKRPALQWRGGTRQAFSRLTSSQTQSALEFLKGIRHTLPPISRRMMDEGVLDRCNPGVRSAEGRWLLNSYLAECRDAEERHEVVVSFTLLLTRFRLAFSCCERCLFARDRCICGDVNAVVPQHKLWLFQHVGEFGRNNNTGSLLCLMAGAERTIRGIQEQQDMLLDHVNRHNCSTVILFPNSDSVTLEEYRRERVVNMGSGEEPLTLVLLDGTSRQAKNFDRFMPSEIPRVRIRETSVHSWLDPIRRQTEEHRVCTAQAAAMILDELGDKRASQAIEGAVKRMLKFAEMKRYVVPANARKEKRHVSKLFGRHAHAS